MASFGSMPQAVTDRLVSIHAKLLQLVESLAEFQTQIEYGGSQGMMGWQDILNKYSLLTSYTHSVFDLLVTPPTLAKTVEEHKASLGVEKAAYKTREEQRVLAQQETEAWKRALSQCLVHPAKGVEPDKEFIVGVLLRTKQVPEVEALEADFLTSVPSTNAPEKLYKQVIAHDKLVDGALEACRRMKDSVDDREFHWKARITGDDDEEDEDEDEMNVDKKKNKQDAEPKYTTVDLGRFMREGILGR